MSETKLKPYKEVHLENVYNKTYTNESENGTEYPKNKISIDKYSYSGEYLDRDKNPVSYEGVKFKITNSKMELEDGQFVKKKKVVKTNYGDKVYNDETQCVMSDDDFQDMLHFLIAED